MARRGDKVQQCMHPIIAEAGVALDTRLLRKDIVVLALEVGHNFLEAVLYVKHRSIIINHTREGARE